MDDDDDDYDGEEAEKTIGLAGAGCQDLIGVAMAAVA
jgi:hypothetical protein